MNSAARLRVAVVGGGLAGSAAAWALARRGARVTLIDQFALRHDRGGSHGETRLFRLAYYERPDYVPLLRAAREGWRALERQSGRRIYEECGVLEVGPGDGALIPGVARAARAHDLPVEALSAAEGAERFPWFRLAAGEEAVFERQAGFLRSDQALAAFQDCAKGAGAQFLLGEAVVAIERGASITIRTKIETVACDRLVLAPGSWARPVFEMAGLELPTVRASEKCLGWLGPDSVARNLAGGFTPFAFEEPGGLYYGFPALDARGVKVAEHSDGEALEDPGGRSGDMPQERARIEAFLRRRAPGLPARFAESKTCLYALSPDRDFLLGATREDARIVYAAGLSGHGFKFGPALGEALADLAVEGASALSIGFLSPSRFEG